MKTLNDWLDGLFAHKIKGYGKPLSRVADYFKALELDDLADTIITVTGTNGKGSTVRLLESIYLAAGYRVAVATSPHLINFTERLTLNGKEIDESLILDAFQRLDKVQDRTKINAFDFIYTALFYCIKNFKPQIALLEVGAGGRLDLTNIFDAKAAVLTTVGLDHMNLLGPTRDAIAYEKAHLARRDCPFICGEPDAPQTLFDVVCEKGARLYQLNSKHNGFCYLSQKDIWTWQGPQKQLTELPIPVIKLQNAATALMAVESMQQRLPVSEQAIREGLQTVHMPGRFEVVQHQCPVILDVAHNPQACHWLVAQLAQMSVRGRTIAVFGLAKNKDLQAILTTVANLADVWIVSAFNDRNSFSAAKIQQELQALGVKNCYTSNDFQHALESAFAQAGKDDRIVIFGSFSAVQEAKQFLGG